MPIIIQGTSRKVMMYRDYVIKIPINHIGVLQSQNEYNIYHNAPFELKQYLAPVLHYDTTSHHLIMRRYDAQSVTGNTIATKERQTLVTKLTPYLDPVALQEALHPDNTSYSQTGTIKIIDYGFNQEIIDHIYLLASTP